MFAPSQLTPTEVRQLQESPKAAPFYNIHCPEECDCGRARSLQPVAVFPCGLQPYKLECRYDLNGNVKRSRVHACIRVSCLDVAYAPTGRQSCVAADLGHVVTQLQRFHALCQSLPLQPKLSACLTTAAKASATYSFGLASFTYTQLPLYAVMHYDRGLPVTEIPDLSLWQRPQRFDLLRLSQEHFCHWANSPYATYTAFPFIAGEWNRRCLHLSPQRDRSSMPDRNG